MRRKITDREGYGAALKEQMQKKNIKPGELAGLLDVSSGAVYNWLSGAIPSKKYLTKIEKLLNLKLVEIHIISPQEATTIQEQANEQTLMSFDDEDEQEETETATEPERHYSWLHVYRTSDSRVYKASDDTNEYLIMRQQISSKKSTIPFVLKICPKGGQ